MIIDCIADLHGYFPELEGGDLLIIAGDLTKSDTLYQHSEFLGWLHGQKYKKKIFIAGNHDNNIDKKFYWDDTMSYLCDSGTEFEGLRIWGSPWTKSFLGMNPKCKAFTLDTEEELAEKWNLIPDDIDILITHCPPYGILDSVNDQEHCGNFHVGSKTLITAVKKIKPQLHVFGHVHEGYGNDADAWDISSRRTTKYINASHVNEHYEPVNKPIRVIL